VFLNRKNSERFDNEPKVIRENSYARSEGTIYKNTSNQKSSLQQLVDQSQKVLLTITSIYPLDWFPDTLTVDENKVNIIRKELFGMENIHSILIEDITNVTVGKGFFTATLEIVDSTNYRFPETYRIKHLNVKKALLARRLIQGLIAAKRQGVSLADLTSEDVLNQLENLGRARGENGESY